MNYSLPPWYHSTLFLLLLQHSYTLQLSGYVPAFSSILKLLKSRHQVSYVFLYSKFYLTYISYWLLPCWFNTLYDKYFCNCKYLILYACIWYTWGSKCRKMPDEELEGKSEETLLGLGLHLKLNDSFCLFVCFVWFVCLFLFLFLERRPQQNFKKTAWSNSHLKLAT